MPLRSKNWQPIGKYIILCKVILFQVPDKGEDGLGWMDAVLNQWDQDQFLEEIVDEVLGTFYKWILGS